MMIYNLASLIQAVEETSGSAISVIRSNALNLTLIFCCIAGSEKP